MVLEHVEEDDRGPGPGAGNSPRLVELDEPVVGNVFGQARPWHADVAARGVVTRTHELGEKRLLPASVVEDRAASQLVAEAAQHATALADPPLP